MKKKEDRLERILTELKKNTAVLRTDLARQLDVSEMTVRRDLQQLAEENLVTLVHGGAVLNQENYFQHYDKRYLLSAEGSKNQIRKKAVGEKAASLIEEGDIIIIDSGSTTEWIAKSLPEDMPIHVICYALNILVETYKKENTRITFIGGNLHRNTLMFESWNSADSIGRYRATKAFFSASGIHRDLGVTSGNSYETGVKTAGLQASLKKILCIDSSKFGNVSVSHYADILDFDTIITDGAVPEEYRKLIEERGVELITAE